MAKNYLSVSVELNDVHSRLFTKLKLEDEAKENNPKAKKMQILLQYLKNPGTDSGIDNIFKETFKNSLTQANILPKGLFQEYGGYSLERDLAILITTIEREGLFNNELSDGERFDMRMIGNENAIIKNSFLKIVNQVNKKIAKSLKEENDNNLNQGIYKYLKPLSPRQGKIDVTGIVTLEREIIPEWKEIIDLFKNASFSLKNYGNSTIDFFNKELKLGETIPEKAYLAMLSSLGYTSKDAAHIYYHSWMSYYQDKDKKAIREHFYHLRFAYELSGYGLMYQKRQANQMLNHVQFFVFNIPGTKEIYVKSTAEMILKELNKKGWGFEPFDKKPLYVKKSYFARTKKNKT